MNSPAIDLIISIVFFFLILEYFKNISERNIYDFMTFSPFFIFFLKDVKVLMKEYLKMFLSVYRNIL